MRDDVSIDEALTGFVREHDRDLSTRTRTFRDYARVLEMLRVSLNETVALAGTYEPCFCAVAGPDRLIGHLDYFVHERLARRMDGQSFERACAALRQFVRWLRDRELISPDDCRLAMRYTGQNPTPRTRAHQAGEPECRRHQEPQLARRRRPSALSRLRALWREYRESSPAAA